MNYKKLTAILCAGAFITLSGCGAAEPKGDEITIEQEAAPKADSAEVIEKQEVTEEEQEIVTVSAKDAVHDLLASNVVYDHDVAEERAAVEDIHFSHTILGVILRKKAVCDGIAKSFKYLLNAIGIRCIVVNGNADNDMYNNEDHAWNIVKIGEHSYHIDVTNDTNSTESGFVCQDYYCLNDELINRDHSNYKGMPICDSLEENIFYKNGAIIKNSGDMDIFIKDKLGSGFNRVYFMLNYVDDMARVANDIQESVAGYIMQKGTKAKIFTVSNEKMRTVMLTVEEF